MSERVIRLYRGPHTVRPKPPTGLDWDALTPRCRVCGTQSGRLDAADTCPACARVTRPAAEPAEGTPAVGNQGSPHPRVAPGGDRSGSSLRGARRAGSANTTGGTRRRVSEMRPAPAPAPKTCPDCGTTVNRAGSRCAACRRAYKAAWDAAHPRSSRRRDTGRGRGFGGGIGHKGGTVVARIEEITGRYLAGESIRVLAAELDVTTNAVRQALKRHGVALRSSGEEHRGLAYGRRCLNPMQAERVVELYRTGRYSLLDLAEIFTVSENGIRSTLVRAGVRLRPPSRRVIRSRRTPEATVGLRADDGHLPLTRREVTA